MFSEIWRTQSTDALNFSIEMRHWLIASWSSIFVAKRLVFRTTVARSVIFNKLLEFKKLY